MTFALKKSLQSLLSKQAASTYGGLGARLPMARCYGTIQQGGGTWAQRATAQEEKFIHEHEAEVLKKLREKQATPGKETAADAAKVADDSPAEPVTPETLGFSPAASAGSSVLGKREGALEDQWIREHEKEKK